MSLYKSRGRRTSEDYFLGGRQLPWWLIGVSIVAANISTEQFVGMAGQAAGDVGLAVSAWQLTGAVGIVVVAFTFLPRFLRAGIYTMPEYLEYRYSPAARTVMSVLTVVIYVTVTTTAVLYSGATALETIFGISLPVAIAVICGIAIGYVLWGGLLAAVWADLFQGSALLVGGLLTLGLGLAAVGGPGAFLQANADRLHMILPRSHPELPWTVLVGGMWIPIFYYCGLNQFITQRTLAARSLGQGQAGIVLAAALWLLVPFAIVMPGAMAHQLYGAAIERPDQAYPMLIRELVPTGLRGFILAALAGAVISTLASVLNSASTLFTMDLYRRFVRKERRAGRARGRRPGGDGCRPGPRRGPRHVTLPEGRRLHLHPGVPGLRVPRHRGRVRVRLRGAEGAAARRARGARPERSDLRSAGLGLAGTSPTCTAWWRRSSCSCSSWPRSRWPDPSPSRGACRSARTSTCALRVRPWLAGVAVIVAVLVFFWAFR